MTTTRDIVVDRNVTEGVLNAVRWLFNSAHLEGRPYIDLHIRARLLDEQIRPVLAEPIPMEQRPAAIDLVINRTGAVAAGLGAKVTLQGIRELRKRLEALLLGA